MAENVRKTRQGHKLCVTNLIKTSRKLIEQIKEDQDEAKLVKLESKRNTLIKPKEEIKHLNEEILKAIKEDEIETEIMKSCDFTEETEQVLVITKFLKEYTQISCTTEGPKSMNPPYSPSLSVSDNSKKKKIKLPKLEIKQFSGNPGEWVTFWDSFQSAIHVDKTAADTIPDLQLTSSNYEQAIKLLTDRFASKQRIMSSYMNTLFKLSAEEIMDLTKFRYLFDQVESTIRSLQSVRITPESYESFVAPLFMSKLPNELRLDINKKITNI